MATTAVQRHNTAMNAIIRTIQAEAVAAILTWTVVTGLVLYQITSATSGYAGTLELTILLTLANLVGMLGAMSPRLTTRVRWASHVMQLLSALTLGWLLPIEYLQIFTIIWIAMATQFYSMRVCVGLLVGIAAYWFSILTWHWFEANAIFSVALFATFHVFALLTSRAAHRAEQARDHTQELYRELVATQHLLTEASRQSERTRIARDLHDLVGHHLTALSINLQIAERLSEGEAKEKIAHSRALARLLLSDVREAVSTLREQGALDFRKALALLIENVPQLDIDMQIADDVEIDDVEIADAIIRCVQEAITNTLRHSGASRSWIRVWRADGLLQVSIRDDGRAVAAVEEGNGLAGMRERLQRLGGTLRCASVDDALSLQVQIPLPGN